MKTLQRFEKLKKEIGNRVIGYFPPEDLKKPANDNFTQGALPLSHDNDNKPEDYNA